MTERAYDPELAHIVPLLPVESDWSDLDAARGPMAELVANLSAPQDIGDDQVRFEDRAETRRSSSGPQ